MADEHLLGTVRSWLVEGKFDSLQRICEYLEVRPEQVHNMRHHQTHAAAAFYPSPFKTSTVITMDGVGEYETLIVSIGLDRNIEQLYSLSLPHSLGLFYSAFTVFCGFEVNEGEYKVMGMSAYGDPVYLDKMRSLIRTTDDGLFTIDQDYFNFDAPQELPYTDKLLELFGSPREPESTFRAPNKGQTPHDEVETTSFHFASIAASLQRRVEEVILQPCPIPNESEARPYFQYEMSLREVK